MELTVHPGIGDLSWVLSKLSTTGMKFRLRIAEDKKTARAMPLVGMVDCIEDACHGDMHDYVILHKCFNCNFSDYVEAEKKGNKLYMTANWWVDSGKRLEGFLPDLETDFHYDIHGTSQDVQWAAQMVSPYPKSFLIYASSAGGIAAWSAWTEYEWVEFIRKVRQDFPHVHFFLIGAKWDADMRTPMQNVLNTVGISYTDLIGQTSLGQALELIRFSDYVAGYASGMTILANVANTPTLMLYPDTLTKLMRSWPCPVSLANGSYQGHVWARPTIIYSAIKSKLKEYLS